MSVPEEQAAVAEARAAWHAHILLVTSAAGAPINDEEVWRDVPKAVAASATASPPTPA